MNNIMQAYSSGYSEKDFVEEKESLMKIIASRRKLFDDELFMREVCREFIPESSFEEYKADIVRYLMLCSWRYTDERELALVKKEEKWLKMEYQHKTSVETVALDCGYCCG